MSEPSKKRRRKDVPLKQCEDLKSFSCLPPDVTVSEILVHIRLRAPDMVVGWEKPGVPYFGYFSQDRGRYPWFAFRNIELTYYDIIRGVAASAKGESISNALPAVNHKQVNSFVVSQAMSKTFGSRSSPASAAFDKYQFVQFTSTPDWRPGYPGGAQLGPLPELSRAEFDFHFQRVMKGIFGRGMKGVFGRGMVKLQHVDTSIWRLWSEFGVCSTRTHPMSLTIEFMNLDGRLPTLPKLAMPGQCSAVTKITNVYSDFTTVAFGGVGNLRQLFQKFSNLRSLIFKPSHVDWGDIPLTFGSEFEALFRDGRQLDDLWLPGRITLTPSLRLVAERVTKSLRVTARSSTDPPPRISPGLKKLGLSGFLLPPNYITPYELVLHKCQFAEETVVLCSKTRKLTLSGGCQYAGSTHRFKSDTLVTLRCNCDCKSPLQLIHLTFDMPKLKRVYLEGGYRSGAITINSDSVLDILEVKLVIGWHSGRSTIRVKEGAKVLKLFKWFPQLDGKLQNVRKVYLEMPENISKLRNLRGYNMLTGVNEVHVVGEGKSPKWAYEKIFIGGISLLQEVINELMGIPSPYLGLGVLASIPPAYLGLDTLVRPPPRTGESGVIPPQFDDPELTFGSYMGYYPPDMPSLPNPGPGDLNPPPPQ